MSKDKPCRYDEGITVEARNLGPTGRTHPGHRQALRCPLGCRDQGVRRRVSDALVLCTDVTFEQALAQRVG